MLSPVNIIGETTRLLETLLAGLGPSLNSPAELNIPQETNDARINIYLYQVLENPYSKNQQNDTHFVCHGEPVGTLQRIPYSR